MTAPAPGRELLPAPGDWILDPPRRGEGVWHRVESCTTCRQCPAGWVHVWCRPYDGGQLGALRAVLAPVTGLAVERRQPAAALPGRTA